MSAGGEFLSDGERNSTLPATAIGELSKLGAEAVALARELIRVDTSNPPGNETAAAELLGRYLAEYGIEAELTGPDPARLNLVARIEGSGTGPSLALCAHTDVVPAPPEGWSVPPFAGEVREGRLIGRGATDMKGELAARAAAFAAFARSGERPAGDVLLIAQADEEANVSDVGMSWLVRERPDVAFDFSLDEGGGILLDLADGRRVVTISVGEKLVSALRLRFHGRAGHASVPRRAVNPLRLAARATEALLETEAPARIVPPVGRALEALGAPSEPGAALAWAAGQHPILADLVAAMTRLTVTPTGLRTHEPSNVIPPCADVLCDCRALPGQGEDDVREHLDRALAGIPYEMELLEPLEGGTESPTGTALYRVIETYVAQRLPGALLLPILNAGFTDSHWIRSSRETVAYGFAPVFHTDAEAYSDAAHADDEAIAVADVAEMAEFHLGTITALQRD
ncbi:MAG: M20/M25/M40 family metallo-hydrolase [Solirubrobacterales bacterium]